MCAGNFYPAKFVFAQLECATVYILCLRGENGTRSEEFESLPAADFSAGNYHGVPRCAV